MSAGQSTSPEVANHEPLARFIFSSRHLNVPQARVKAEAFMPHLGEVSVFRTEGMAEPAIWAVGSGVGETSGRTLHGRGDIQTSAVRKQKLDVQPSEPPPRHANIVGWPEDDKDRRKLLALELARAAKLVVQP